jgi:ubiquinone/menaquinone biosynthesis C-methylase UbiE
MTAPVDSLTSPTLKHLRERWWNDEFTQFLAERLRPRPGNRILDVGCGEGLAEISLSRLQLSQIRLAGVDLVVSKVEQARREAASHNQRVLLAAADAVQLPFRDGSFDSTFCVAVLQHLTDVESAVAELARVTRSHGRVVAVEPDNAARYVYSSLASGAELFAAAQQLFAAIAQAKGERSDAVVGPRMPERFARHGIEPVEVRVFPVSHAWIGAPPPAVWDERRAAMTATMGQSDEDAAVSALASRYFALFDAYRTDAERVGRDFVEIQSTFLFAAVGQRLDPAQ